MVRAAAIALLALTAGSAHAKVQIDNDQFSKYTHIIGTTTEQRKFTDDRGLRRVSIYLEADLPKDAEDPRTVYWLIVTFDYFSRDWRQYSGLTLVGGDILDARTTTKRRVQSCETYGCYFTEELSVPLTRAMIDRFAEEEFTAQTRSDAVDRVIKIDPRAFIEILDALKFMAE